jgi:hypothetical protein
MNKLENSVTSMPMSATEAATVLRCMFGASEENAFEDIALARTLIGEWVGYSGVVQIKYALYMSSMPAYIIRYTVPAI